MWAAAIQMRKKKSTHFLSLDSASMVVERERKKQEAEQPTLRQCWACSEELGKSNRLFVDGGGIWLMCEVCIDQCAAILAEARTKQAAKQVQETQ
jgi:hypothetical protein